MQIDIAVPTHNSGAWLGSLFESIINQNATDWRIIVRDDDSNDNTSTELMAWKHRLGDRLQILTDNAGNLGMIGNYNAVLSATTAPFVMLADPDDVWLSGKISASLSVMRDIEPSCPAVVCSDARVIDDKLQTIADSYWKWSRHDPRLLSAFSRMIVESPALTSTMTVNRALLDIALPMTGAACPDWWLALVACAFGTITYLPQQTILYRRHAANDSVAPITSTPGRFSQARSRVAQLIRQYGQQAGTFRNRFGKSIPTADLDALRAAEIIPSLNSVARRLAVIRHGLWFASPIKNAGLMLLL